MNANPVERDELIFNTLRTTKGIDPRHIALYTNMSTSDRIGVGLSEAGVAAWNAQHKRTWFKYYDIFGGAEEPPEDFAEPMVAIFVNAYRSLDVSNPGTADHPNMISQTVPISAEATEWVAFSVSKPRGGVELHLQPLREQLEAGKRTFTRDEVAGVRNYRGDSGPLHTGRTVLLSSQTRASRSKLEARSCGQTHQKPLRGNEITNAPLHKSWPTASPPLPANSRVRSTYPRT